MMSTLTYSLNGQTLIGKKLGILNNEIDTIEFIENRSLFNGEVVNGEFVLVPIQNIINANNTYFNLLKQLELYKEIVIEQDKQISDLRLALIYSENETDHYKRAYNKSELINLELRGIIKQEQRRTIAFGVLTSLLIGYIIYDGAIK